MKRHTAVEYLIEHIKIDQHKRAFTEKEWNEIFEIAMKLERARLINSFVDGSPNRDWNKAEEYYDKVYKK